MKLFALALLLPLFLPQMRGQAPAPLPNAAGCGAGFSNPGFAGYCFLAIPAVQSQGIYSYTLYNAIANGLRTPTVTTQTGGAIIIRSYTLKPGKIDLLGLGTVGVAITSTATTGAFSGGGGILYRDQARGWTFEVFGIQQKAGTASKLVILCGPGFTW